MSWEEVGSFIGAFHQWAMVTVGMLIACFAFSTGTSTHDGLGIAFAVCEELIRTRALVFFATHFQELASSLPAYHNVVNLHLETEVNIACEATRQRRIMCTEWLTLYQRLLSTDQASFTSIVSQMDLPRRSITVMYRIWWTWNALASLLLTIFTTVIGLSLAKTMSLPGGITQRAEEISTSLTRLQENARRESESDKVIARRRALAQVG